MLLAFQVRSREFHALDKQSLRVESGPRLQIRGHARIDKPRRAADGVNAPRVFESSVAAAPFVEDLQGKQPIHSLIVPSDYFGRDFGWILVGEAGGDRAQNS
jgi:hypothetical protein